MSQKYTLAVDPGIRGCGVALFDGPILIKASYVKNTETEGNGPFQCSCMADEILSYAVGSGDIDNKKQKIDIVVEWPQVYTKSKGDPNDLLALAGIGAALVTHVYDIRPGQVDEVIHYLPREWKGQVPKTIHQTRIKKALAPEEIAKISAPKSLLHNVYDAVGLGLFRLGRMK